jgi:hypothetical protein
MTKPIQRSGKETVCRIITAFPGVKAILKSRHYFTEYLRLARIGDAKKIFEHHYAVNEWGSEESVSGPGSEIKYTENIRKEIPRLVSELGVKVILDAPCGDYHWFRMITLGKEVAYIGGDIVRPLIERNQSLYGRENTNFIHLDIVRDSLPKADLWLCRDCLLHLSNRDAWLAIDNFLQSDIRYLLTSTNSNCDKNHDIPTGSCRLLNLRQPPFSFGEPMTLIDDWIEGYPVRHLALWERESLKSSLGSGNARGWAKSDTRK